MSIVKHTRGPWEVFDSYDDDCKIIVWDGDEQAHAPICDMGEMGDMDYAEALANAKLIAAAPELLAALKQLVWNWENDIWTDADIAEAKAAIEKAES